MLSFYLFRFTQVDEDIVSHCFRYTVPVLTSVIALQKERQLKQETQVGYESNLSVSRAASMSVHQSNLSIKYHRLTNKVTLYLTTVAILH